MYAMPPAGSEAAESMDESYVREVMNQKELINSFSAAHINSKIMLKNNKDAAGFVIICRGHPEIADQRGKIVLVKFTEKGGSLLWIFGDY